MNETIRNLYEARFYGVSVDMDEEFLRLGLVNRCRESFHTMPDANPNAWEHIPVFLASLPPHEVSPKLIELANEYREVGRQLVALRGDGT